MTDDTYLLSEYLRENERLREELMRRSRLMDLIAQAVGTPGSNPLLHRQTITRHKREFPALWQAVAAIVEYRRGTYRDDLPLGYLPSPEKWLDYGVTMGYCSEPRCDHHEGIPYTDDECDYAERAGRPPCTTALRFYSSYPAEHDCDDE